MKSIKVLGKNCCHLLYLSNYDALSKQSSDLKSVENIHSCLELSIEVVQEDAYILIITAEILILLVYGPRRAHLQKKALKGSVNSLCALL